jgi:hypothetical protein
MPVLVIIITYRWVFLLWNGHQKDCTGPFQHTDSQIQSLQVTRIPERDPYCETLKNFQSRATVLGSECWLCYLWKEEHGRLSANSFLFPLHCLLLDIPGQGPLPQLNLRVIHGWSSSCILMRWKITLISKRAVYKLVIDFQTWKCNLDHSTVGGSE